MATKSNPTPRPVISYRLFERIEALGRIAFQKEIYMIERNDQFCAMLKDHAFAIFCFENPTLASSIGYQPRRLGDPKTEWSS